MIGVKFTSCRHKPITNCRICRVLHFLNEVVSFKITRLESILLEHIYSVVRFMSVSLVLGTEGLEC